jgi:SAM-dependent methyltransferase
MSLNKRCNLCNQPKEASPGTRAQLQARRSCNVIPNPIIQIMTNGSITKRLGDFREACSTRPPKPQVEPVLGLLPKQYYPLPARILGAISPTLAPVRTDVSWYNPASPVLDEATRSLLEDELHLSGAALDQHLLDIRHQTWQLIQYPCFGQWWFLRNILALSPHYNEIIKLAQTGASVADLACGLGQDLRWLRKDGATGPMHAIDAVENIWNIGLQLFGDRKDPPATFLKTNLLDNEPGPLKQLNGKLDIILLNDFLYLTERHFPEKLLQRLARLSKIGTKITGWTFGTTSGEGKNLERYQTYDPKSFEFLWVHVWLQTQTKWSVNTSLVEPKSLNLECEDWTWTGCPQPAMVMWFMATRME